MPCDGDASDEWAGFFGVYMKGGCQDSSASGCGE